MGCCSSSNKVEDSTQLIVVPKVTSSLLNRKANREQNEATYESNRRQEHDSTKIAETPDLITEIKNWKTLIDTLQKKESLKQYGLARKRTDFRSLDELYAYISAYKCENQFEQAWLIYVWITDNIEYNMYGLMSGNLGQNDPDSVLRTGLSVCEGFASLYERLCQVVGIECRKISGYSKAFGYSTGGKLNKEYHAWNVIKIDNKWYYVESTWGAGYADSVTKKNVKRFEPYWFLTPPDVFLYKHYSESCQLQSKRITLEEFEKMPNFELKFHLNGIGLLTHNSSTIVAPAESPLILEFSAPHTTLIIGDLKDFQSGEEAENTVFIQRDFVDKSKYVVKIVLPRKNTFYKFSLYAKQTSSNQQTYDCVAGFRLIRKEGEDHCHIKFLTTFSHMYEAYLKSPLDSNLRADQSYSFEYYIKGVCDVTLVDSSSKWYHLNQKNPESMLWTLEQSISELGELKLYAKAFDSQDNIFNCIAQYIVI